MITQLLIKQFILNNYNSERYSKLAKKCDFLKRFNIKEQIDFMNTYHYGDYKLFLESDIEFKSDILKMMYDKLIVPYVCSNSQFRSKCVLEKANKYRLGNVISVGSWVGQHYWFLKDYKSFTFNEIDESCIEPLSLYNKDIIMDDMMSLDYSSYSTVVNTSCEHVDFKKWLGQLYHGQLVIIQSTNYECDEHINTHSSLEEFMNDANLSVYYHSEEIEMFDGFKRFFIIGII